MFILENESDALRFATKKTKENTGNYWLMIFPCCENALELHQYPTSEMT